MDGFAREHRDIWHDDPFVYEITVQCEDVSFESDDRSDHEITLLRVPPEIGR